MWEAWQKMRPLLTADPKSLSQLESIPVRFNPDLLRGPAGERERLFSREGGLCSLRALSERGRGA